MPIFVFDLECLREQIRVPTVKRPVWPRIVLIRMCQCKVAYHQPVKNTSTWSRICTMPIIRAAWVRQLQVVVSHRAHPQPIYALPNTNSTKLFLTSRPMMTIQGAYSPWKSLLPIENVQNVLNWIEIPFLVCSLSDPFEPIRWAVGWSTTNERCVWICWQPSTATMWRHGCVHFRWDHVQKLHDLISTRV